MKVLIVMPSGQMRGGAEEALRQLWVFGPAEWGCVVLEAGPLAGELQKTGDPRRVTVLEAGRLREPLRLVRTIRGISHLVREGNYDFVLGWMTKAHLYGGPAARLAGRPSGYFQMGLPDGGVVDRLSRWLPATGALGCSRFVAEEQRRLVPYPVLAVPLAADLSRFAGAEPDVVGAKSKLGFDPALPLVGIVGRLQRWKGMHVFAEAMALVAQRVPAVQVVIVGGRHDLEPEYETWLRARISALGLDGRLRMAGGQSNVAEWMQAMDVCVHASEREPFGIVVVEAMALGRPVVAAIPGGPAEIIRDGIDGLLTTSGDPVLLAGAILRFLEDPAFAAACGASARQRARDFSVEAYVQNLVASLARIATVSRQTA